MALVAVLPARQAAVCLFKRCKVSYTPYPLGSTSGKYAWATSVLACINDLPDHVSSLLYMYANDVKCARPISSHDNGELLQDDLNSLGSWSKRWRMTFKVSKCAVLQCITGKTSPVNSEYELNGVVVKNSDTYMYKDLGVFISADQSFTTHYNYITSRAYRMLGLIRRTFTTKTMSKKRNPCTSAWCAPNYHTAQFCGDQIYSEILNCLNGYRGGPPNIFSMTSAQITKAGYWP